MKKVVSLLLCAVMLIGLLPVSAFAAGEAYQFKIVADKTEVNPGDQVKFTITVTGTEPCDQLGLLFQFDRDVFEVVKGVANPFCEDEDGVDLIAVKSFSNAAGKEGIAIAFDTKQEAAKNGVVYSGKIGNITLKVKENANFTESALSAALSVKNGTNVLSSSINEVAVAMIPAETEAPTEAPTVAPTEAPTVAPTEPEGEAVYQFKVVADKTEVNPGDQVKFTITVTGTEPCDQLGLLFQFDRDVFEVVKGVANPICEDEDGVDLIAVKSFSNAPGKEGIAIAFDTKQEAAKNGVVYSGKIGNITLKVKENANFTESALSAALSVKNGTNVLPASINEVVVTMTPAETEPTLPPHVHAWIEVAAVEPTCDTEGNIAYKYCECGEAWTLGENPMPLSRFGWVLGALGHTFVDHAAVEPTCQSEGNIAYQQCSVCGYAQTAGENPVPLAKFGWILAATGNHTFEHHDAIAATCDTEGHEAFDYCTTCECFFYEDPLKLTYQAGIILPLGHTWVEHEAVEPTCDLAGNIAYAQCSVCGAAQTLGENPIPLTKDGWVLGPKHSIEHVAAKDATVEAEGNIEYWYCTVCGAAWLDENLVRNTNLLSVILPKLEPEVTEPSTEPTEPSTEPTEPSTEPSEPVEEHTWVEYEAVAPSCNAEGNIAYKICTECGEAWTLEEEPKPLSKYGWILGPTGEHTFEHHDAIEATCDENGHEAFDYCTTCECFFYEDPLKLTYQAGIILATGHTWVEHEAVEPTCDLAGNIAYAQCSVCGAAQTLGENPIPLTKDGWVLGAKHSIEHVAAKDATVEAEGNIEYWYCTICGAAWLDENLVRNTNLLSVILPKLEPEATEPVHVHTWVEYAAVEPTCDTEGNVAYKQCSECGEAWTLGENPMPLGRYGWVLGALGHTWVDVAAVEPTCDTEGNIAYQYCSVCGAAQTAGENPIPLSKYAWVLGATGHDWVDYAAVEPTCDTEGNIAYQLCVTCGAAQTAGENPMPLSKYGWVLGALGHTWVDVAAVEPTCDTEGNIAYQYCSVCGAAQTAGENPLPLSKYGWILGALGHTWVEHEAVEPTCDLPGNIAYAQCDLCGAAQTLGENPIPLTKDGWVLGPVHSIKHVAAKAPTAEAEGNVEYWYCEDCGYAWLDEAQTKVTNLKSVILPKIETPATGDTAPVAALIALAVMSLFGMALIVSKKKFSV